MNTCTFINLRIAGPAKFTPAYITADGKQISAKASFNCKENARGKSEHTNDIGFTAWGALAETMARSGAPGKKLSIVATLKSYTSHIWYPNPDGTRSKIQLPDGSFMTTKKNGFTVTGIDFGEDSKKQIAQEIQLFRDSNGTDICSRPEGWNQAGTQQEQLWFNIRTARNTTQFQPGMQKYVFAEVQPIPQGASYAPPKNAGTAQIAVQQTPAAVQNFNTGAAASPQNTQPNFAAPTNMPGFMNTPVGNPAVSIQGGQVGVHGTNMGTVFTPPAGNPAAAPAGFTPPVTNAPVTGNKAIY